MRRRLLDPLPTWQHRRRDTDTGCTLWRRLNYVRRASSAVDEETRGTPSALGPLLLPQWQWNWRCKGKRREALGHHANVFIGHVLRVRAALSKPDRTAATRERRSHISNLLVELSRNSHTNALAHEHTQQVREAHNVLIVLVVLPEDDFAGKDVA